MWGLEGVAQKTCLASRGKEKNQEYNELDGGCGSRREHEKTNLEKGRLCDFGNHGPLPVYESSKDAAWKGIGAEQLISFPSGVVVLNVLPPGSRVAPRPEKEVRALAAPPPRRLADAGRAPFRTNLGDGLPASWPPPRPPAPGESP